jgi:methyl-accepting chemotaxis protein
LVESITEVGQMIADIESASREQTAGISEVTEAVSQMDEMTQRNAALVEEAAASSRSLEEQAQLVLEQLNFFKTQHQPEDLSIRVKSSQVKATELKRPPLRTSKNYLQKPIVESDDEWEEF